MSDLFNVTTADVLRELRTIVEEVGPDHIYRPWTDPNDSSNRTCFYIHPTRRKPDCLAGRIMAKLGVHPDVLATNESLRAKLVASQLGATKEVASLLNYIQVRSDMEAPWGEILKRAEAHYATPPQEESTRE